MLQFNRLSLRRGTRLLLEDVTGIIHAGQRVGVTGANGSGKSSLFALLRGQLEADSGDFSLPPDTVIAHVAQETPAIGRNQHLLSTVTDEFKLVANGQVQDFEGDLRDDHRWVQEQRLGSAPVTCEEGWLEASEKLG